MAASSALLSEEHLQCSICLEIFTKPVSTPCGHNFCMVCLNKCWDKSKECACPFCKKEFAQRPELCVNTFISNLAAQFIQSVKEQSSTLTKKPCGAQGNVSCDVCAGPTLKALKSCLDCGMSFCGTHLEPHKTAAKLKQHKLIDAVKNLEDWICQRHQRPVALFCRDDQKCVCLYCTEGEHKGHITLPIEEENADRKTKMRKTQADVQKMIQDRLKKIKELKHSVTLNKKSIDKEKEDSTNLFGLLKSSIERLQTALLVLLEEKQKDVERQAQRFVKALEQEIAALKGSDTELEILLHSEGHLHLLQDNATLSIPTCTYNWDQVQINSRLSVRSVMEDLLHLQEFVNNVAEKVSAPSLDDQKEDIARLLKTRLEKGDTWYLVDSRWFKTWKKYVGFDNWNTSSIGDQTFYPGPVDNSGLLKDSLTIKEHLIDELDYILLPEEAWDKLIKWYGLSEHQNPIARKVILHGLFVKYCKVEVYLTELKLCEFSQIDCCVSREFSKADTLTCVEKEMHKIFNIPDWEKTRLWVKYMSNSFECLNNPDSSILDTGLFGGQVVLIEIRNQDGTWPQEAAHSV